MLGLPQLLKTPTAQIDAAFNQFGSQLRVATIATVVSFDEATQTVSVQPNVQEIMTPGDDAVPIAVTLPQLDDVPICMMRAGGWSLTLPIAAGDECIVIFADACIDAWFQHGGTQPQMDKRRHDLSDAIAIFGVWNQTRVLSAYSTSGASLRSDDGSVSIALSEGTVTIQAATVNVSAQNATVQATTKAVIEAPEVDLTATSKLTISGNGQTTIDGAAFANHTHSGGTLTGGLTGPVTPGS